MIWVILAGVILVVGVFLVLWEVRHDVDDPHR